MLFRNISRTDRKETDMYKMEVYRAWDGGLQYVERSNSLDYFSKYKGKTNYRIVITKGKEVVYSELKEGETR